eukprot:CAMPEP_0113525292 /NCGR_PEP_ID=MMETSP0015_2-20120614/74_1 /TAXON_ID=2838 /ORGANISM="Odontella" /LENGTH=237 /DNA_ID=CAMNT_0000423429 /DNA_START=292 /DNA_END=1005 /DNA_ORIENTATION=+ /assembly_acc=CAM_ASM_000160
MSARNDEVNSHGTIVNTVNWNVDASNSGNNKVDWNDRIGLQRTWSNNEKGWKVQVEWRQTPYGAGVFALQDIAAGTLMRQGVNGINLIQFLSVDGIETFCKDGTANSAEYDAKLNYVADYMWGFNPNANERGYDILEAGNRKLSPQHEVARFFGMWVPGNGLNHNLDPNTVYCPAKGGTGVGIDLVALSDIVEGEELFDDYRRHGSSPVWLLDFGSRYNVTLNFAECNDFVLDDQAD